MVKSMVEKVARAMFDADASGYHGISAPFEEQTSGVQDRWLRLARAAIEAMREPTGAMVMAADWAEAPYMENDLDLGSQFKAEWRAAIDTALNEQVPG